MAVLWKELLYATFDPLGAAASGLRVGLLDYLFLALIALTIVVSLQAVGIILVVAMLVTPAATAQLLTQRFGRLIAIAIAIGVACPIVGLYLSFWLDTASGATIVLVETARVPRRSSSPARGRAAAPATPARLSRPSPPIVPARSGPKNRSSLKPPARIVPRTQHQPVPAVGSLMTAIDRSAAAGSASCA